MLASEEASSSLAYHEHIAYVPEKKKAHDIERLSTGIETMDGFLEGGYPKGDIILVCGGPGSGKTTLGLHFLINNSIKRKSNNVFVTLQESPVELRLRMCRLGLDVISAEKKKYLTILDASMSRIGLPSSENKENVFPKEFTIDKLASMLHELQPQPDRLVFDSLSALEFEKISSESTRKSIFKLFQLIKKMDCTSVFTSETYSGSSELSSFGVEEYLADGIISVKLIDVGTSLERELIIRKMRGTAHSLEYHKFKIGKGGIFIVK